MIFLCCCCSASGESSGSVPPAASDVAFDAVPFAPLFALAAAAVLALLATRTFGCAFAFATSRVEHETGPHAERRNHAVATVRIGRVDHAVRDGVPMGVVEVRRDDDVRPAALVEDAQPPPRLGCHARA